MENEQRTYGLAEWAAALRVRRTEEELAAATRERQAGGVRVRKNVKPDRESIEVERILLSGEASEAADRRG